MSGTTPGGCLVIGTSSWSFTTAVAGQAGGTTMSFYNDSDVPDVIDGADPSAVTLGMRFASTVAGTVDGVRFYKAPGNTGTHTGYLYRVSDQALLGTVTFTGESAAGWQTAMFDTPIAIAADTDYMVAYRAPAGHYSLTTDAFSGTGVAAGTRSAPPPTAAPTPTPAATPRPRPRPATTSTSCSPGRRCPSPWSSQVPAADDIGVAVDSPVTLTMNSALASGAALSLSGPGGAVSGTSALSSDGLTLTFTPTPRWRWTPPTPPRPPAWSTPTARPLRTRPGPSPP